MKHLIKHKNKSLINNSIRLFREDKIYNNFIPIEIIFNIVGKYGAKKDYMKLLKFLDFLHTTPLLKVVKY